MITIKLCASGLYLVWNATDVRELRAQHRIVGQLVGPWPAHPRQNETAGLPLVLMAEQVRFLVAAGQARVLVSGTAQPSPQTAAKLRTERLDELRQRHRVERQAQIVANLDRIVEGKLRKMASPPPSIPEFRLSVQRELEAAIRDPPDKALVMHTRFDVASPYRDDDEERSVLELSPLEPFSLAALRYAVFKHFHCHGYFLTCGLKFGADFLAYDHDPLAVHAKFLVVCCHGDSQLHRFRSRMAQAFGRLAKNVRKNVVVAHFCAADDPSEQQLRLLHVRWNVEQ